MTTDVVQLTRDCFDSNGWLVTTMKFRHEPAQLSYALDVAHWISKISSKPLALLEGDTGTGKTLGYLVPLFLHSAITGARGVIATHTINLQNQILDGGDIDIANHYLESVGFTRPKVQQLIGRQEYLDPERFEDKTLSIIESGGILPEATQLIEAAYRCAQKEGLLDLFLLNYGPLPNEILPTDICLTEDSDSEINKAYTLHRNRASKADIVITSHTMLLLNRKFYGGTIFESPESPISNVVIDEADMLAVSAEMFSSKKLHPKQVITSIGKLKKHMKGKGIKEESSTLTNHIKDLHTTLTSYALHKHDIKPVIFDRNKKSIESAINELIDKIKPLLARVCTSLEKCRLSHEDVRVLRRLSEQSAFFDHFSSSYDDVDRSAITGVSWSKKLKIPSLELYTPFPAQRIKAYWRRSDLESCNVLLTSATLTNGRSGSFKNIKGTIQAFGGKDYFIEASHSPSNFGTIDYVLSSQNTPKPLLSADEHASRFHTNWVKHARSMIDKAVSIGPTLCLCVSYREAELLAGKLVNGPIHLHRPGHSLKSLITRFQSSEGGVLITPSAWEGVSIRSLDNEQFITQLVITRVPYRPPSPFKDLVMRNHLMKSGVISQKKADSIVRGTLLIEVVRKLRQGCGRLIRTGSDIGTIWVCDPRFSPEGLSYQDRGLAEAVPSRFLDKFTNAPYFDVKAQEIIPRNSSDVSIPKEILEWI